MSELRKGAEPPPPAFEDTIPHPEDTAASPPAFEDTVPHPGDASAVDPQVAALKEHFKQNEPALYKNDDAAAQARAEQYLQEMKETKGAPEALARGSLQGVTGNFSDEATGVGESLIDKLLGRNKDKSFNELRVQHTEEARAANAASQAAHPALYAAGNVAGGAALSAIPGVGAAMKAAPILTGAGIGALSGVGAENGETLGDAAWGAAKGGTIGALSGGLSKYLASRQAIADAARTSAAKKAFYASGASGPRMDRAAYEAGMAPWEYAEHAGEEMLDRGVVQAGDTQASIADKAVEGLRTSGKGTGAVTRELDQRGASMSAADLIKELRTRAASISGGSTASGETADELFAAASKLEDEVANGVRSDQLPMSVLENSKKRFAEQVTDWRAGPAASTAAREQADIYRNAAETTAKATDAPLAARFIQNKEDVGLYAPIAAAARARAATNAQRTSNLNLHALGPKVVGGLVGTEEGYRHGGIPGAIAGAATGAVLGGVVGPRVPAYAAVGMNNLSKVIASAPVGAVWTKSLEDAAQRGSVALGATNFVLQQQSPEYREHVRSVLSDNDSTPAAPPAPEQPKAPDESGTEGQ